ncbi:hypothetical protein GYMLUDRAFT_245023 [Collybiopsis luxurians FD-317 M1]|uniref:Uncharacterized protein n=1 Tax=Collybiopsis luxurians FD-317 M1 TaxID=944289 RepID=A0A0D0CBE9_9AGAR|nr:hypothetical protein GYMLUDRAFT_245023 [Collybiopsis luxurians FD-317 M1]
MKRVPILTTTADVRRMLARHNVQGVTDVAILYEKFVPKKQALITLSRPTFLRDNLRALENATLSGSFITSEAADYSESGPPPSTFGNGPHAGVDDGGKSVLLSWFPSTMDMSHLVPVLQKYQLAGSFKESVIPTDSTAKLPISVLVKTASESEAYRIVRDLHMTNPLEKMRWSKLIQARIIH